MKNEDKWLIVGGTYDNDASGTNPFLASLNCIDNDLAAITTSLANVRSFVFMKFNSIDRVHLRKFDDSNFICRIGNREMTDSIIQIIGNIVKVMPLRHLKCRSLSELLLKLELGSYLFDEPIDPTQL